MKPEEFIQDLTDKNIPNDLKEILLRITKKYAKIKDREAFLKDLHGQEEEKGMFEL
jgi:hypothetical protein